MTVNNLSFTYKRSINYDSFESTQKLYMLLHICTVYWFLKHSFRDLKRRVRLFNRETGVRNHILCSKKERTDVEPLTKSTGV